MNKYQVEKNMGLAQEAIRTILLKGSKTGSIDLKWRSKMSAFGATVLMSGLKPAIAYYAKNEPDIIGMIYYMTCNDVERKTFIFTDVEERNLVYEEILCGKKKADIDQWLTCSVSLKLVLNLFV